ncbi:hypothetical protein DL93DRAFT_2103295 [Clavulina sp. PMI_390]|nr:hypothetical protein DL93DRAFT_2103295 [Clavulina sp. PMI_390]
MQSHRSTEPPSCRVRRAQWLDRISGEHLAGWLDGSTALRSNIEQHRAASSMEWFPDAIVNTRSKKTSQHLACTTDIAIQQRTELNDGQYYARTRVRPFGGWDLIALGRFSLLFNCKDPDTGGCQIIDLFYTLAFCRIQHLKRLARCWIIVIQFMKLEEGAANLLIPRNCSAWGKSTGSSHILMVVSELGHGWPEDSEYFSSLSGGCMA